MKRTSLWWLIDTSAFKKGVQVQMHAVTQMKIAHTVILEYEVAATYFYLWLVHTAHCGFLQNRPRLHLEASSSHLAETMLARSLNYALVISSCCYLTIDIALTRYDSRIPKMSRSSPCRLLWEALLPPLMTSQKYDSFSRTVHVFIFPTHVLPPRNWNLSIQNLKCPTLEKKK